MGPHRQSTINRGDQCDIALVDLPGRFFGVVLVGRLSHPAVIGMSRVLLLSRAPGCEHHHNDEKHATDGTKGDDDDHRHI